MGTMPETERVLAAASGSTGGLGKISTILASGVIYVRLDNTGYGRSDRVDWRVKCNKAHTVQLYRARSVVDSVTATLASMADGETGPILNGLTYTAEDTAASAAWASRKYYTGGADDTADAVQLAALINADYAITPNGSVAVADYITVVTTDAAGGSNTYTYTAAAAADYDDRIFDQSGNQAAELASIVLALNHARNVTLATLTAGNTITVERPGSEGYVRTYTAHASTTTASAREFSIAGTDTQDGDELVVALNDATYGITGYTATNAAGVVSIRRNSADVPEPIITSSSATLAACVNKAGGVPGISAAATGATGELAISPTWVKSLVVTTSNNTRLALVDIDCPGVKATSNVGVVTITPGTTGSPVGGEKASVLEAQTGTGAGHCACAQTTLASLVKDGSAITGIADNSTTAGALYTQYSGGWDAAYIGVTNNDAANAATIVVGATRY